MVQGAGGVLDSIDSFRTLAKKADANEDGSLKDYEITTGRNRVIKNLGGKDAVIKDRDTFEKQAKALQKQIDDSSDKDKGIMQTLIKSVLDFLKPSPLDSKDDFEKFLEDLDVDANGDGVLDKGETASASDALIQKLGGEQSVKNNKDEIMKKLEALEEEIGDSDDPADKIMLALIKAIKEFLNPQAKGGSGTPPAGGTPPAQPPASATSPASGTQPPPPAAKSDSGTPPVPTGTGKPEAPSQPTSTSPSGEVTIPDAVANKLRGIKGVRSDVFQYDGRSGIVVLEDTANKLNSKTHVILWDPNNNKEPEHITVKTNFIANEIAKTGIIPVLYGTQKYEDLAGSTLSGSQKGSTLRKELSRYLIFGEELAGDDADTIREHWDPIIQSGLDPTAAKDLGTLFTRFDKGKKEFVDWLTGTFIKDSLLPLRKLAQQK